MIKIFNTLFVTMFGLGKIPRIPGPFGSLATIIILYIFYLLSLFFVIYLVNVVPDDLVWDRFNYYVFFDNSSDYLQRMEGVKDYLRGEYVFHYLNN